MPSKMENYDFILIYGLNDNFEMEIISKLIKPKIIWFVMGADIYEDKNIWKKNIYCEQTVKFLQKNKNLKSGIFKFFGTRKIDNWKYKLAMMRRIDFIANYRDNQFLFLKKNKLLKNKVKNIFFTGYFIKEKSVMYPELGNNIFVGNFIIF